MYRKGKFAKGMGASLGVILAVVILVLHSGTAYAVPLAGLGGFTIKADEIRGQGAYIYAGADDTSQREGIPMAVTEFQSSEIDGLQLIKKQDVSSLPGVSGTMKMTISGTDTVTTGQQIVKASNIKAEEAILRRQVIDESPSDDPNERFTIAARGESVSGETVDIDQSGDKPGLVLKDATINAHYLATNKITIPGQEISISYDPDGDGEFEQKFGA